MSCKTKVIAGKTVNFYTFGPRKETQDYATLEEESTKYWRKARVSGYNLWHLWTALGDSAVTIEMIEGEF